MLDRVHPNLGFCDLHELLKFGLETERVETGVAALDVREQGLVVSASLRAIQACQTILAQPCVIEFERRSLQIEIDVLGDPFLQMANVACRLRFVGHIVVGVLLAVENGPLLVTAIRKREQCR
jgi:hypothetical protein